MKTENVVASPINFQSVFGQLSKQLEFDLNLKNYKDKLIAKKRFDNILILQNQFFYILDFTSFTIIYVHPNALNITGYPSFKFQKLSDIYDNMHPDDKNYVIDFSIRSISITRDFKVEFMEKQATTVFSIDFRFIKEDGQCIRLNRQTCCFQTDKEGNMVYGLVVFTDLSNLKNICNVSYTWMENKCYDNHFEDLKKKHKKDFDITKREKDVLILLSNGYCANDIAIHLNISDHTIISHRKNLLHKTGTKNTAELVKFAVERNII